MQPRQQNTLQDCQMLQQQIWLKQMQELWKHQKFSELADGRQQNYLNQQSGMNKHISRDQASIHAASENMFMVGNMNLMPQGASAAVQGIPNGLCSQAQPQDLPVMNLVPQQPEGSYYRTPIVTLRNNFNQYSHLQVLSPDSNIGFTKSNSNQTEKPADGKPLLGENHMLTDLHSFADGTFQSKQLLNGKDLFGTLQENFQQVNSLQVNNNTGEEFNMKPEQPNPCEQFRGNTTKVDPPQGVTTLDPLELKILFNIDNNSWNSSFGGNTEVGSGGYTSTLECSDYLSSFPSIQSGSLSALMHSAVAEASSTDTGVQEEWSGLSFQNTELSTDNQPSNNADNGKKQTDCVDTSVTSLNVKPRGLFGAFNMNASYSGFQQSGVHLSNKQEGTHSDSSHESPQQSPKVAAKWYDRNLQQVQLLNGSQPPPSTIQYLGNVFPFQDISTADCNPSMWGPSEAGSSDASLAKSHDQASVSPSVSSGSEPRVQQVPKSHSSSSLQRLLTPGNHGATAVTGPVYMRNELQMSNLHAPALATQSPQAKSPNLTGKLPNFDLFVSQGASQSILVNGIDQQFPILETLPVESSRRPPGPRTNALPQACPSNTEPRELPSNWLLASDSTNTDLQPPCVALQGQNSFEGTVSHELASGLPNSRGIVFWEEHRGKGSSDQRVPAETMGQTGDGSGTVTAQPHKLNFDRANVGDKPVPSVSARDLEAFGRSLKPSNLHPNYSNTLERNLGLVSVSGLSTSTCMNSLPTKDINILSLSPEGRGDDTFQKSDDSQVNVQMAPPWFKQYRNLKNGHMLQKYDRIAKSSLHPSPLGKHLENSDAITPMGPLNVSGANQISSIWPNTAASLAATRPSPPDFDDPDLSISRFKKRKIATPDLPWHKEVTQSFKRLQSISIAEIEWAEAVNRRIEKMDYEIEVTEDVLPLLRPRKRLILTTQLMQQLFMPSPTASLSAKAARNYESVTYFSAKLALRDACNLMSWLRNDSNLCCTKDDMIIEKSKTSERISERHLSTFVEDFTTRAKKLEADLPRLDKTTSIVDIVVEFKELEKFSILNRFARFHVQRQQYAGQTSTSSGATSSSLKPTPRRYVDAFPMPRALPERAQCLSL